jgi:hypothetical protein
MDAEDSDSRCSVSSRYTALHLLLTEHLLSDSKCSVSRAWCWPPTPSSAEVKTVYSCTLTPLWAFESVRVPLPLPLLLLREAKFHWTWQEQRVPYVNTNMHSRSYLAQLLVKWEMFQRNVVEKTKTHFMFNNSPPPLPRQGVTFMTGKIWHSLAGHRWQYGVCTFHFG